jgi:hypothetical protein
MSEFLTHEQVEEAIELYPGVIEDTVARTIGYRALTLDLFSEQEGEQ